MPINIKISADTAAAKANISSLAKHVNDFASELTRLANVTPQMKALGEAFLKVQMDFAEGKISIDQARESIAGIEAQIAEMGGVVEEGGKKTDNFASSMTELNAKIDFAKQAISTFSDIFKTAFDMGKEGATIIATHESLDRLAESVGASSDLLGELEKAAGGTVDDLDLAGSTIRLLTGETGSMAKALADASPQLLTIARAAVKLNPTLGTTAEAYEAITRAIETGQTRALKNYGIVLEDVENKQDALNQILEAGGTLIEQVGGNVENAVDPFSRLEFAVDDLKDALMVGLAPALTRAAEGATVLLTASQQIGDAITTHAAEVVLASGDYAEYRAEMERVAEATLQTAVTQAEATANMQQFGMATENGTQPLIILSEAEYEAARGMGQLSEAGRDWSMVAATMTEPIQANTDATIAWTDASLYAKEGLLQARDAVFEYTEAQAEAAEATEKAKQALDDLQAAIGGPVGEEYDSFIAQHKDLTAEADALKKKINELTSLKYLTAGQQAELDGLQDEFAENQEAIKAVAEEHKRKTQSIIFDLLAEQIAMSDLPFDQQLAAITAVAEHWGLVDQATANAMAATSQAINDFLASGDSDKLIADIDAIAEAAESAAGNYDIVFNLTQVGSVPNIPSQGGGGSGGPGSGSNAPPPTGSASPVQPLPTEYLTAGGILQDLAVVGEAVAESFATAGTAIGTFGSAFPPVIGVVNKAIAALGEGEEGLEKLFAAASAFGGLGSFASQIFGEQTIDPLKDKLEGVNDEIEEITKELEEGNSEWYKTIGLQGQLLMLKKESVDLSEELAAAEKEVYEFQQKQQQLGFLKQQFELLEFLKENDLSLADVGLTAGQLGAQADPLTFINAMTEALEKVIAGLGGQLPKFGFQHGVSNFVVPPGYPNDSYTVGLTSGETVSVSNGSGIGQPLHITVDLRYAVIMSQQDANRMMQAALREAGYKASIYQMTK